MISVVAPVYNNAATIEELALRLTAVLASQPHEIVFVNDGSTDDSLDKLKLMGQANRNIKVLSLSRNFGQHPAIGAGFDHAQGDIIVLMDADLQDRPEEIPHLLSKLTDGIDIVYTIKEKNNAEHWTIRVTSALYHLLFSKVVGTSVPPRIGTFRAFTRKFLDAVLKFKERNILYGPMMFYVGFKSDYVEVMHDERRGGKSSYTFSKRLALAINSLVTYTDIPHKVLIYLGLALFFASIIYGVAVLLGYMVYGKELPAGLTLVVMLLTIMLGSIMVSMGILGSYVFRVYQEVLARPRYLVADKINIV